VHPNSVIFKTITHMIQLITGTYNDIFIQHVEPCLLIFTTLLQTPFPYKAKAMTPATAAAMPISSLPAAPVDSARPPVEVPVAAVPEGLGAEPVAVARVLLLELSTMMEPVPEAEAEAPVPLGLTLPVEVGTLVAAAVLAFVSFHS
jgi:hypothetical protein